MRYALLACLNSICLGANISVSMREGWDCPGITAALCSSLAIAACLFLQAIRMAGAAGESEMNRSH